MHDSTLADWGGLCDTLEEVCVQTGGVCCCVHSAFAAWEAPHLINSAQNPKGNETALQLLQHHEATSIRQIV